MLGRKKKGRKKGKYNKNKIKIESNEEKYEKN